MKEVCWGQTGISYWEIVVLSRMPRWVLISLGGLAIGFVSPIDQANASQGPTIRVLVLEDKTLRLRGDAQQHLLVRGIGPREQSIRTLEIRHRKGNFEFNARGYTSGWTLIDREVELMVRSRDPRGIWLGNRRYRGQLRVYAVGDGLQVVNHLGLEKYLVSVVGSEMPKSWPISALKAQAVAARTYALKKYGNVGSYDIKATESSQVYLGIEAETRRTREAVRKTHPLVLTHKGQLIHAVFHSSSGGLTEASGAVWKEQFPYLVSTPDHDQESPTHQWDARFSPHQLRTAFKETGGIKRIVLLRTSPTGRILKARVNGPSGSLVVTGKELRGRLGLKSTLVRFKMIRADSFEARILNSFLSSSMLNIEGLSPSAGMRKSFGFWRDWSNGGESVLDPRLPSLIPPPPMQSEPLTNSFRGFQEPPPLPSTTENLVLLARGFGSGHGVGMSQWGAHALADKGANFRQILNHYYKGVVIRSYKRL